MHPIEHLRHLARTGSWMAPEEIAAEAVWGLATLSEEEGPAAMVVAAHRLLDQFPEDGPVHRAVTRLLSAPDVQAEAMRCLDELSSDPAAINPGPPSDPAAINPVPPSDPAAINPGPPSDPG